MAEGEAAGGIGEKDAPKIVPLKRPGNAKTERGLDITGALGNHPGVVLHGVPLRRVRFGYVTCFNWTCEGANAWSPVSFRDRWRDGAFRVGINLANILFGVGSGT